MPHSSQSFLGSSTLIQRVSLGFISLDRDALERHRDIIFIGQSGSHIVRSELLESERISVRDARSSKQSPLDFGIAENGLFSYT